MYGDVRSDREDYQDLIAFVKANGLTVSGTRPNRMVMDVKGAVTDIEKAFHVTMRVYQHPTESRTFYGRDVSHRLISLLLFFISAGWTIIPSLIRGFIVVAGDKHRTQLQSPAPARRQLHGKGFPGGLRAGVARPGSGQAVGLVEFDGYYANDITAYEATNGLSSVTLKNVLLDGFDGTPTTGPDSGNAEVALDIEMASSMAAGLSEVIVYEPGAFGTPDDVLSQMVSDNLAKQLSC